MAARPLEWRELHSFLAVARGGTLCVAATTLGVDASTVHRRIAALERMLQTRLFERSPRGYALTVAGAELLAHALDIEAAVMRAERQVAGRDRSLAGPIRVATVDDLAASVLGRILSDFSACHPGIRLDVAIGSDCVDLSRRQAEVAIRPGAAPRSGDVIARRVCAIAAALYASPGYLEQRGTPVEPGALGGHAIVRADEARAHLAMERFVDRHAPGARTVFRSNSMLARLAALRDGLGIGMLPCFMGDAEPGLVRVGPVRPEADAALWILSHADTRHNARVRALVEFTHRGLSRLRDRFEAR
jgi:DNA-binding transcriptional LysR family regulator